MADIEIEVKVKARTAKALLVESDKGEAWVARSQISDYCGEEEDPTSIFIPEHQATEKGLI